MKTGAGAAARAIRRRTIRARPESRCRTQSSRASVSETTFGASVGGRGDGPRASPSRRRLPKSTARHRRAKNASPPTADLDFGADRPSIPRRHHRPAIRPGPRSRCERNAPVARPGSREADSLITGKACGPNWERSKRSGSRPRSRSRSDESQLPRRLVRDAHPPHNRFRVAVDVPGVTALATIRAFGPDRRRPVSTCALLGRPATSRLSRSTDRDRREPAPCRSGEGFVSALASRDNP
jgi:hypothetical protein